MFARNILAAAATALSLAACGGSDSGTVQTDPPPPITFSSAAVAITEDRLAESLNINRNQFFPLGGSATYSGAFLADLEVDFEPGQSLVGEIELSMDFNDRNTGRDNVSGLMSNFGLADATGTATEGVFGTIPLTGTVGQVAVTDKPDGIPGSGSPGDTRVAQNILQVSGAGVLAGTFGQDTLESVPVTLDMIGHARRDPDTDDWFSGVIGGDGQGAYDLYWTGRFYVIED